MPGNHERALEALFRRGRLRALEAPHGIDFTSNDYLGLAQSQELADAIVRALARGVPVGAGGSRLLRGNHPEHEALEDEAAQFFGAETALFFGGGFIANTALLATLPSRGDLIVYDELIHASAHDGMRLSKADAVAARHNDPQSVEDAIIAWRAAGATGQPWIVVESLYSMDGDRAPLDDLAAIALRHDAMLIIDEAHATGVFGPDGRGLAAHLEGSANVITLHTCGKALGVMGASGAGSAPDPRLSRQPRPRLHLRNGAVAARRRSRPRRAPTVSKRAAAPRAIASFDCVRWQRTQDQNAFHTIRITDTAGHRRRRCSGRCASIVAKGARL